MRNIFLILLIFLFSGCIINGIPKMNDYAQNALGMDYQDFLEPEKRKTGNFYVQNWRDKKINKDYYLPNGNLVHVAPERKGCLIHWEIDKDTNKIIGYKFEGNRCY